MSEEKFKLRKFDIVTPDDSVIHGVLYTEKPSFNYSEILAKKDKVKEIKALKLFREKICTGLRINKLDMLIDEKKFRILTSRRIVVKYSSSFKDLGLFPAIVEETKGEESVELSVEYL